MNTPPNSKFRLSCKRIKHESETALPRTSSPENNQMDCQNDDSPLYFPTTQETNEEINVIWDWHSPQTSQRRRFRKQKRVIPIESPKIPLKRHTNNDQHMEKLREELRALQAQLAVPDDEDSLRLSPLQEIEIKKDPGNTEDMKHMENDMFEDVFDDSFDAQLLMCTQQVEDKLKKEDKPSDCNSLINKYTTQKCDKLDDSFNDALGGVMMNDFDNLQKPSPKSIFQRTLSDDQFNKSPKQVSRNWEFSRTKSFEVDNLSLSRSQLEEIEKKKREAMSRRLAKLKQESQTVEVKTESRTDLTVESQNNLSKEKLELIEKKRLEALAKRQAKKQSGGNDISSSIGVFSGNLEIHRTKSFQENYNHKQSLSKEKLEEIERHKLEAKVKLESKKSNGSGEKHVDLSTFSSFPGIEPISKKLEIHESKSFEEVSNLCNQKLEEIERKKLEAKARLELRKKAETSASGSGGKQISVNAISSFINNNSTTTRNNVIKTDSGNLEMHRTKSFEESMKQNQGLHLPKQKLEEIERNKLEAKARLESRKKSGTSATKHISLSTFSPFTDNNSTGNNHFVQTVSGKLEIHRTKSFEDANNQNKDLSIIERNKLEAKARLQSRNRSETSPNTAVEEEIENKRLQAQAKLQEKQRLLDIVEKNRLEALQRLQNNRMKNAGLVKSTLTKRY